MGRYDRSFTPELLARRLRQGRGRGHGKDYRPWLTVRDVPSRGLSSRVRGWKTCRVHHFLSQLELSYFYTLEWSIPVIDIREQYPLLPQQSTLDIADRLKIKHPTDPKTKLPIVMTTDFLIDILVDGKIQQRARTVKMSDALSSRRTLEKLEIERLYWEELGVDWGIVTEREIPRDLAANIKWLHSAKELDVTSPVSAHEVTLVEQLLAHSELDEHLSLASVGETLDTRLRLPVGAGLWAIRHLIANRRMIVDISKSLLERGGCLFRMSSTETNMEKRSA